METTEYTIKINLVEDLTNEHDTLEMKECITKMKDIFNEMKYLKNKYDMYEEKLKILDKVKSFEISEELNNKYEKV